MKPCAIVSASVLIFALAVGASDEAAVKKIDIDAYVTRNYDKKTWFPKGSNPVASVSRDFDYNFTLNELQLAQCAYCYASSADLQYVPKTATVTSILEADGGRVLTGYDTYTKTLFVSFRGSEDIQNWIENVKFFKTNPYTDMPNVEVEIGFNNWYNALKTAGLSDALTAAAAKYGTKSVSIIGHSSGGACSTLMAFDMKRGGYPGFSVSTVTTFGSPRVGNSDFYSAFTSLVSAAEATRVTHYRDIVPHMPQEFMGYHHVYNEVYFNEDSSEYTICDGSGEDDDCSNSCGPVHCTSVSDHLDYMNVGLGADNCAVQR